MGDWNGVLPLDRCRPGPHLQLRVRMLPRRLQNETICYPELTFSFYAAVVSDGAETGLVGFHADRNQSGVKVVRWFSVLCICATYAKQVINQNAWSQLM